MANHKNIGFLSKTGPEPLKITKLLRQHSILGRHRHTSETPFKQSKKNVVKVGPPLSKISGPAHGTCVVHLYKPVDSIVNTVLLTSSNDSNESSAQKCAINPRAKGLDVRMCVGGRGGVAIGSGFHFAHSSFFLQKIYIYLYKNLYIYLFFALSVVMGGTMAQFFFKPEKNLEFFRLKICAIDANPGKLE